MGIIIKGKKSKTVSKEAHSKSKKKATQEFLPVPLPKKEQRLLHRSITKTNRVLSMFGQDTVKIQELLTARDNDNAIDAANRAMLSFLLDLIPIAESRYREDSRQSNAYALGHLVDQARSLISDIQAAGDRSIVTDKVIYDIIQPTMMTLGQFLIDTNYQIKREITDYMQPDKVRLAHNAIDVASKESAKYITAMFNDMKTRVTKALGEG